MPGIQLAHLVKRFARNAEPVVRDFSLTVEDGDFMCILGPSGCGKTTLLRMIAGLEPASEGVIEIGGQVVDGVAQGRFVPPEKRRLGLVFQSYALWPHMSVARNIEFGLRLRKMSTAERLSRVQEVMAKLHIEGLDERYPAQLSGGQQQRVALARMLAVNPGVLLLDEPLSNLDAALRLKMREELSRLHREFGTTIVFVTHDQWEAMTLATRIAVMNRGELQQVGTPDAIYGRPANRFVAEFIGNPPINLFPADGGLARTLNASGALGGAVEMPASITDIGVRPEGVTLVAKPEPYTLPVVLRTVLPTGGAWILELEHRSGAESASLFGVTHTPPAASPGQEVHLRLRNDALHFFDATGRRVQATFVESRQGRQTAAMGSSFTERKTL